jgi:class 3 adenylate cyclase/tetratricopeptide (TPR) repeat protein
VVFTDLVGSTALRSAVGDERADAIQRRLDSVSRRVVEGHGGRVVKGLGDGTMAAFESTADALAGVVALQQQVEHAFRADEEDVQLTVGVSVGDASEDDGDLFGTPVVEAARLCGAADAGQILITEVAKIIAGSRADHTYEAVGALELKGLPAPLPTVAVAWEPLTAEDEPEDAEQLPFPKLLSSPHRLAFAGREVEMAALDKAWAEAVEGDATVVLLAGEPGIGKSRLCSELGRSAHRAGASVLFGRCDDELGVPYQPFVEALAQVVEHWPEARLREVLGPHPGELGRLAPVLFERLPDLPEPLESDPETARYRLFEAVQGWLEAMAEVAPVLLVLDDIHWATRPTLLLLKHLARSEAGTQLMVLGTYRDTDLDRVAPLADVLADLRRLPGVTRVPVGGLGVEEVVAVMERVAGHPMDQDGWALATAIHGESEGNPFFVGEILRNLSEEGAIVIDEDGRWRASGAVESLGIPESVREVVGRRLDRLPAEANEVLSAAAVVGRDFELDVLVLLIDRPEAEILDLLEAAVDARLVDETGVGRFRFAHALVRSTLYDEQRVTRRARLHLKVGEAIETVYAEDLDAHLGELAHHFERASAGGSPVKALEYSRRAGNEALRQLAHDEALARFEDAFEMLADDTSAVDRCDVLLGLGQAQRAVGDAAGRATLLAAGSLARDLGDGDRLSRAALALHRGYFGSFGEVDQERITAVRAALDLVPAGDSAVRARLLAVLATESVFATDLDERRAISDEALAIARRLDDPVTLGNVLATRHNAIFHISTLDERISNTDELRALAARLDDPNLRFWGGYCTWATGAEAADGDRLRTGLEGCRAVATTTGMATHRWIERFASAAQALVEGRLPEAEALAEESFALGAEAGEPDAVLYYGVQLFFLRREQGRLEELEELTAEAVGGSSGRGSIELLHALLLSEIGRADEALAIVDRLCAHGVAAAFGDNQVWSSQLFGLAEVAHRHGRTDLAEQLLPLFEPVAHRVALNGLVYFGPLALARGLARATLGQTEAAIEDAVRATEACRAMGADALALRSALAHAEMLRTVDPVASAALAADTGARAAVLGLDVLEARASALAGHGVSDLSGDGADHG